MTWMVVTWLITVALTAWAILDKPFPEPAADLLLLFLMALVS